MFAILNKDKYRIKKVVFNSSIFFLGSIMLNTVFTNLKSYNKFLNEKIRTDNKYIHVWI